MDAPVGKPGAAPVTVAAAPATVAAAYEVLERLRWGGPPGECPHCGAPGPCYFLRPRTASPRRTRSGAPTERRVWKCGRCRRQFSVLTGTILEGTRIDPRVWIAAASAWPPGPPPAAGELASQYRISAQAARQMVRRLAVALALAPWPDVLRLPAATAAGIRDSTPARTRPRRQVGPSAEYGVG